MGSVLEYMILYSLTLNCSCNGDPVCSHRIRIGFDTNKNKIKLPINSAIINIKVQVSIFQACWKLVKALTLKIDEFQSKLTYKQTSLPNKEYCLLKRLKTFCTLNGLLNSCINYPNGFSSVIFLNPIMVFALNYVRTFPIKFHVEPSV